MLFKIIFAVLLVGVSAQEECKNLKPEERCQLYLQKRIYSCSTGGYLFDNCKETCGLCNGEPMAKPNYNECRDFEKRCGRWARSNECVLSEKFMKKYCKLSCRFCINTEKHISTTKETRKATLTRPAPVPKCQDTSNKCHQYASGKRCYFSRGFMSQNCKLSCKMCATGGKCFDKDSICPYWAGLGYCNYGSQYHSFMISKCKFSCGGC